MYDHILVPLDRSAIAECVLPHAIALARVFDAKITLLQVVEDHQGNHANTTVNPLIWQMQKAEAEAYLEDVEERLLESEVKIEKRLMEGNAAQRILEFTEKQGVDLILLSSHGESGLSKWNISSIVQKVILRAYMPVMIVRAYRTVTSDLTGFRYQRLQVLLDGSARAECVLPLAGTIAGYYACKLILAHAITKPEVPRRLSLSPEEQNLITELVERKRARGEKYLDDVAAQLSVPVEKRLIVADSTLTALHNQVEEENIDLVLLSAHGYSGDSARPYGSISLNFIAFGTTPLLIVQDFPKEEIIQSKAEKAAAEKTGH